MKNGLRISLFALSFSMAGQLSAQSLCSVSYDTVNQWPSGSTQSAQQRVVITNTGDPVESWQLKWEYAQQEEIKQLWGGNLTQAGKQVTVTNSAYNSRINTGGNVDFGFIVSNHEDTAPSTFYLNGQACGEAIPGEGPDQPTDPVPDPTPDPVPDPTPNPTPMDGAWSLKNNTSVFNFLTAKSTNTVEVMALNKLQGSVAKDGTATLAIDLNGLQSGIDIRNERMRNFLFESDLLPMLYYNVKLDTAGFEAMSAGSTAVKSLGGALTLHGVKKAINAEVLIVKTDANNVSVSTLEPVIINSADFDLNAGIETLRTIANLTNISNTVPVYFRLTFSRDGNAEVIATPAQPSMPASLTATNLLDQGLLTWQDSSENETGFLVRKLNALGAWETVTSVDKNINTLSNLMLLEGNNQYKVIALNGSVPSPSSPIASVEYSSGPDPVDPDPVDPDPVDPDPVDPDPVDPDPVDPDPVDPDPVDPDPVDPDPVDPDPVDPDPVDPDPVDPDPVDPEPEITGKELYEKQCARCHGANANGNPIGVPLNKQTDLATFVDYIEVAMPAGNAASCDADCAASIGQYIQSTFWSAEPEEPLADEIPGPRQLNLLSRYQYNNTVNDLLGLNVNAVYNFPVEAKINGYDNNAANNVVSSRHISEYMNAAESLAQQAVTQKADQLIQCDAQQENCRRSFVQDFGRKAFRRALSNEEVNAYTELFGSESASADGLKLVIRTMLMSPNFLYISEMGTQDGNTYRLSQYEIASTLSYIFWGTMPDNALLQTAQNNQLSSPEQIEAAARRLLTNNRARQHMSHFVEQWLEADRGNVGSKDPAIFPRFNDNVRNAMDAEMKAFFNHVVFDSTQQFDELFTADYVFANSTLATYYGISGVTGNQMQMVPDSSGNRGGLLTLGAVMAAHGHSNETAPIPRGKFVRRKIMCQDLPDPPVDLDTSFPDPDPSLTTREKFAARTSNPECQDCHKYLNGVGFGFESFDGAGAFRTTDNGKAVDSSGTILGMASLGGSDQTSYYGAREMQQALAESANTKACMARQFYRFARGYSEGNSDRNTLNNLTALFEQSEYNLQEMMISVTQLQTFTLRRNQ